MNDVSTVVSVLFFVVVVVSESSLFVGNTMWVC